MEKWMELWVGGDGRGHTAPWLGCIASPWGSSSSSSSCFTCSSRFRESASCVRFHVRDSRSRFMLCWVSWVFRVFEDLASGWIRGGGRARSSSGRLIVFDWVLRHMMTCVHVGMFIAQWSVSRSGRPAGRGTRNEEMKKWRIARWIPVNLEKRSGLCGVGKSSEFGTRNFGRGCGMMPTSGSMFFYSEYLMPLMW